MSIFEAIKKGDLQAVIKLIGLDVDINATDEHGYTALMLACYKGPTNIVKVLLTAGAKMETKEPEHDFTALTLGIQVGKYNIVQALLSASASTEVMEVTDNWGNTPLIRSSFNGHPKIVKALLEAGANKDAKNKADKTALDVANEYYNPNILGILKSD